jgi:hypothetical protein
MTPEALRIMEEASPTDLELQNNMAIVDECGNAGEIFTETVALK